MGRKDTVLFVDDEPYIIEGLRLGLRKEPYHILTASSGEEGLQILSRNTVDVVVADEQMPGMCGSEFLTTVCKKYPATIRIILTGHASIEAAMRAINEGEIYRFLKKPCNVSELGHTIHQALQLIQLKRESTRLLGAAREQQAILLDLEKEHPGIAKLPKTRDGRIVLKQSDFELDALVNEINHEIELFECYQGRLKEE